MNDSKTFYPLDLKSYESEDNVNFSYISLLRKVFESSATDGKFATFVN